jgi:hypothetical protein
LSFCRFWLTPVRHCFPFSALAFPFFRFCFFSSGACGNASCCSPFSVYFSVSSPSSPYQYSAFDAVFLICRLYRRAASVSVSLWPFGLFVCATAHISLFIRDTPPTFSITSVLSSSFTILYYESAHNALSLAPLVLLLYPRSLCDLCLTLQFCHWLSLTFLFSFSIALSVFLSTRRRRQ